MQRPTLHGLIRYLLDRPWRPICSPGWGVAPGVLLAILALVAPARPARGDFAYRVTTNLTNDRIVGPNGTAVQFVPGGAESLECDAQGTSVGFATLQQTTFNTDTFDHPFQLIFGITDLATNESASLTFDNRLYGSTTPFSSMLMVEFKPPTSHTVVLGDVQYTVKIEYYIPPFDIFMPGSISGSVTCAVAGPTVVRVKKDAPGPAHDGTTWDTAYQTVQAAIDAAPAGAEVWVAAGTYAESVDVTKLLALYGGFAGTETERSARQPKTNATILRGNATGAVVHIRKTDGAATLDGFTVENGGDLGGILVHSDAVAAIRGNVIRSNGPAAQGGGVSVEAGASGRVTIERNILTGNTAAQGGAVFSGAAFTTIASNLITGNTTTTSGGGVTVTAGAANSTATLVNNTVVANTGGGIAFVASGTNQGAATLRNNIVADNGSFGLSHTQNFTFTLKSNDILGHTANYQGLADATGTQGNVSVTPVFLDAAGGDYRLCKGSPLIDLGDDADVQPTDLDLDGNYRQQGMHVDLGAYEHTAVLGLPRTMEQVRTALRLWAGLQASTEGDIDNIDLDCSGPGAGLVDLGDITRILFRVTGREPNPS